VARSALRVKRRLKTLDTLVFRAEYRGSSPARSRRRAGTHDDGLAAGPWNDPVRALGAAMFPLGFVILIAMIVTVIVAFVCLIDARSDR
jgi:hypothetical protein